MPSVRVRHPTPASGKYRLGVGLHPKERDWLLPATRHGMIRTYADWEVHVSAGANRWSGLALAAGAVGLGIFWLGSRLFLDWGGIFGIGLLLVLSTGLLIFGIIGLHSQQRRFPTYGPLGLIGVLITAFGLVSRAVVMLVGVGLFSLASIRAKTLPRVPFALVMVGALLLGLEEWRYGTLLALRNDEPIPEGTPLTLIRWLVGAGYVFQSFGWIWLGTTLWLQKLPSSQQPAAS